MQGTPAVLYAGWAAGSEFRDFPPEWEKLAARPKNWMFRIAVQYRNCLAQAGALGLELGGAGRVSQRVRLGRAGQRGVGDVGLRVRRVHMTSRTVS